MRKTLSAAIGSSASLFVCAVILLLTGCSRDDSAKPAAETYHPPVSDPNAWKTRKLRPEGWIRNPPAHWPQLVLTNLAMFNEHTSLRGASSFLVRTHDTRILAATARHLIGSAGGVKPAVKLPELDAVLQSWKMFPRTFPQRAVEIAALAPSGDDRANCDWLILKLKGHPDRLPAEPLLIEKDPVKVGDKVYLVGCPYTEPACRQNVYVGRVTERKFTDRFRFDLDPPVEIPGFSGAPIIDERGHLVGVMTIWFEPKMDGDKFLEAGGEDVATVFSEVEGN